ncbi:MAG: HAD family hydrolase [Candidatus Thorarchaeota archaeon]
MIKCVSFDFDRTLAYVHPLTHYLVPQLLQEKGITISVEEFKIMCVELRNDLPTHLVESFNRFGSQSKEQRDRFIRDYNRARLESIDFSNYSGNVAELKEWLVEQITVRQKKILYEDVFSTIKRLNEMNIRQYILSGNHSDGIIELLEKNHLLTYFEEIITVDKYHQSKIKNFEILLAHSKLSPEKILHIGDDIHTDIYGSQQYQIKSILISRPEQLSFSIERKDDIPEIKSLDNLFDYLEK